MWVVCTSQGRSSFSSTIRLWRTSGNETSSAGSFAGIDVCRHRAAPARVREGFGLNQDGETWSEALAVDRNVRVVAKEIPISAGETAVPTMG